MRISFLCVLLLACDSSSGESAGGLDAGSSDFDTVELVLPLEAGAKRVAASGDNLYVLEGQLLGLRILRVGIRGPDTPEILFEVPSSGGDSFRAIRDRHVGSSHLLFTTEEVRADLMMARYLWSLPLAGGEPTLLDQSSASRSYLGMTIHSGDALFSSSFDVWRVPLDGSSSPTPLVTTPEDVRFWIYSPKVVGNELLFTSSAGVFYRFDLASVGSQGEAFGRVGSVIDGGFALMDEVGETNALVRVGVFNAGTPSFREVWELERESFEHTVVYAGEDLGPSARWGAGVAIAGALGTLLAIGDETTQLDGARSTDLAVGDGVLWIATEEGVLRVESP